MNILIVCDLDDWVLGEIARRFATFLRAHQHSVTVLTSHAEGFALKWLRELVRCDVVHFLSPWDYFEWSDTIWKPCVTTLWHMVDWSSFDTHMSRIDALCVGSDQWIKRAKTHVNSDIPIYRLSFGFDVDTFRPIAGARQKFLQSRGLDGQTVVFGFAGSSWSNEGNRKGLDRLWEGLTELQSRISTPFVLRMIGRCWSTENIPTHLQKIVHLDGFIEASSLPEYYSSLDYYTCFSRHEGVPYPVFEAMSCQTTVVTTNVGIVPEYVINGRNGFILNEGSIVHDFINTITHTIKNPQVRKQIRIEARRTVTDKLAWGQVLDLNKFFELYTAAIRRYSNRDRHQRQKLLLGCALNYPRHLIHALSTSSYARLCKAARWILKPDR